MNRLFSCLLVPVLLTAFGACAVIESGPLQSPTARRDETVKLQVFLDSKNFGPGVIDGREGEFTSKAADIYERVMGRRPDLTDVIAYTRYTVAPDDFERIGQVGSTPEEMAAQKRLPYTTILELVAEQYRSTPEFLQELNPDLDLAALAIGQSLTVPNVSRPLRVEEFPSNFSAPPAAVSARRRVDIDTSTRLLRVIDGDRLIAVFPISPGSAEHPAPVGEWRIVGVAPWPWFRWDEGVLKRGERTESFHLLPPGVNSPVGILWAGLNRPGIGIHGSPTPETIGRAGSHGCVRLSNWDAATFYTLAGRGTPVVIR